MSDIFSAHTSVSKELKSTAPPSNNSLLLQLPTELLIGIVAVLDAVNPEEVPCVFNPLPVLRLTCKRLAEICAPMLFRSVFLKEVDPERHRRLADNAQQLGGLVHHVTLSLENGLDSSDLPIYAMLGSMPNVRSMTVVHEQQDVAKHTPLRHAVEKYVHLEEVTLQEKNCDPGYSYVSTQPVAITATFFHTFLCSVLKVHGERLKALHLYTPLALDPQVYIDLRDKTPNLRSVIFNTNIGMNVEGVFAEPIPWASGQTGHLESLTFQGCGGTHADSFVENILRGVYGVRLKEVQFICSGKYWIRIPEPPSFPVFTSIEHLHFDHINTQELSAISLLPIHELSLTRISHNAFSRLPTLLEGGSSNSGWAQLGFRGLKRLRLSSRFVSKQSWERATEECKAAYEELRERCLPQRGVQLTLDAANCPVLCSCYDHE